MNKVDPDTLQQVEQALDVPAVKWFEPYPSYKLSGIDWLGDVPEHWEMRSLKYLAKVQFSNVDKHTVEGEIPVRLCNYTDVYYNEHITQDIDFMQATATEQEIKLFKLEKGDVLITKDSEDWSDIAVPALVNNQFNDVLCGYHLAHIRPYYKFLDSSFLLRSFVAFGIRDQFNLAASGVTRYGLPKSAIMDALLTVPPLEEQQAIARFLDEQIRKIDDLIEAKRKLLDLLKEKRQAIITHAVTKGIDPDFKLKPSGIEWLGDVPEHWEVLPAKRCASRVQTGSTPPTQQSEYYENGTIPWYGPSSIGNGIEVLNPVKFLNINTLRDGVARYFKADSVLVVGIGATIGKVAWLPHDASTNQQITVISFHPNKIKGKLAAYQLKIIEVVLRSIAPSATLPILDQQEISSIPIVVPPIEEQIKILTHIDEQLSIIDSIEKETNKAIERLTEYRTALISAAVTGKIDVRGRAS